MRNKIIITIAGLALLGAGLAAGAAWSLSRSGSPAAQEKKQAPKAPSKYVTLDKVIVMLRRAPGETQPHYLSADLVLATSEENERHTKEHLPLLRSIAVRTLSSYALADASGMTVEQYADVLNQSFNASYAKERLEKPFTEVMIGKLIIE